MFDGTFNVSSEQSEVGAGLSGDQIMQMIKLIEDTNKSKHKKISKKNKKKIRNAEKIIASFHEAKKKKKKKKKKTKIKKEKALKQKSAETNSFLRPILEDLGKYGGKKVIDCFFGV